MIILFALFNSYTIPFKVAFNPVSLDSSWLEVLNGIIDLTFLLDMIFTFRTIFMRENGDEVDRPWDIAANYFKTTFAIDLVAMVPLD